MTELACSICGGHRLGPIQKGIDNLPVALCYDCRDRRSEKKRGGLNSEVVPLMPITAYKAPERPKEAKPVDMWSLLPEDEQRALSGHPRQ